MITTPMPSSRRARAARREARRQQKLTVFFVVVGMLVVVVAFAGGFAWQGGMWSPSSTDRGQSAVGDDVRRAEALKMLDEAVQANYEERPQGVANALQAARELDSTLPGVDAFVAEMALTSGDAHTLRRAAQTALRKGERVAAASLLLALEKWMNRGQGADSVVAGDVAKQYLEDAAQSEPSNGAVYFFWGEMSRTGGGESEAWPKLLGALYREQPWRSSALLAAKLQLADREAQGLGRPSRASLPDDLSTLVVGVVDSASDTESFLIAWQLLASRAPLLWIYLITDDRALKIPAVFSRKQSLPQASTPRVPIDLEERSREAYRRIR
jgi:hypothetical protein